MINRDESELIARERRNQPQPSASQQTPSQPAQAQAQPHREEQLPEHTREALKATLPANGFRTLVNNRTTRHAPG